MASAYVLDDYYLAITALVTVAYQLFFFAIAFTCQFDKLTDLAGGSNFVLVALLTLGLSSRSDARPDARQLVASLFLVAWAVRLSAFLFFRILRTGSDDRFDDKRHRFFPFLGFWVFQMLWVWTVSLPVTVLNSPAVGRYPQHAFGTGRDVAGVVLFALAFSLEAASDVQKYRFRATHDGSAVCDAGLFALSRHPNYFGEIIVQFSIYMIAVSPAADGYVAGQAYKALYATILGPLFLTFLLMFVSGLPLSERPKAKARYEKGNNWEAYSRWLARTSILVPFPPRLYARVPLVLKRTLFLEFPMYVFDPAKHSDRGPPAAQGESDAHGQPGRTDDQSAEQRLV